MSDNVQFRMGELFSGPGGLARGAELAATEVGIDLAHGWAVDSDPDTCATYRKNIAGASQDSVICADIRGLDLTSLGRISGLAFGFPCNDFSAVGERLGFDGKFGPLYSYGIKVLELQKPDWFVAENVSGIRSSNEGSAFVQILREMIASGYAVTPHLYKFENYGVPQARHRVVIVGIRSDLNLKYLPPASEQYKQIDVSARTALEVPPIPKSASGNQLTNQSPSVVERLSHIKPGQNAFNADLPEHLKLNVKGATISQIYRRLDPDKPSYTVTGSGGGGTHVYHWEQNRALTNRERARLQTFPDDFEFEGGVGSVRRQIGMAVPVQGSRVIFEALFKTFLGLEYETTKPNLEDKLAAAGEMRLEIDIP